MTVGVKGTLSISVEVPRSLKSMYNVTDMYNFRVDHLVLDNQSVYSSPEKAISPIVHIPQLLVDLGVGLRPHELFYFLDLLYRLLELNCDENILDRVHI